MPTLADTEVWSVAGLALGAISLVVNVVVGVVLFRMKNQVDDMRELKQQIQRSAEQLIESRLTGVASHLEGVINVVNERVSNIRERLTAGEVNFADLDKRDRELEVRFGLRFEQLKDYLHKHFATKDDAVALHRRIDAIKNQGATHGH